MGALTAYTLTDVGRSQRLVPPLLLLGAVVTVLYSGSPSSLLEEYAVTAVALYPIGAWIGLAVLNTEDDVQRDLTVVAAGGAARVATAKLLAAHLVVAVLAFVLVGLSIALGRATGPLRLDPVIGLAAHLICGACGVAVGTPFCHPIVLRLGWAVIGILAALLLTLPLNRVVALPPVVEVTRVLLNGGGGLPGLAVPAAAALAFAAAAGLLTARLVATKS